MTGAQDLSKKSLVLGVFVSLTMAAGSGGGRSLPAAEFRIRLGSSPEQETSDPKPGDPKTLGFWGLIPKKGVHKLLFG